MYSTFSDIFRSVLDRHALLKWKMIRGNQGPFMTKQISKAIMSRCKLRNRYIKWPSRENFLDDKKAKNTCNNLSKYAKKSYFDKVTSKGFVSNKAFWNTVKPFLTNKGFLTNANITIKRKDEIVTDNSKPAHLFNSHYINIVENTSGIPPDNIGNPECKSDDHLTVEKIFKHHKNQPSIETINKICNKKENFDIHTKITEEINKIIKELDPKKATGLDKIPPKIVKMSANVIDSHLANVINNDITKNVFSEKAKVASVRPIFKKNELKEIENYRPVSILNCFSKVYEKFLLEKFKPFINSFLSEYMAAFREKYSTNHVLIRLIEIGKKRSMKSF